MNDPVLDAPGPRPEGAPAPSEAPTAGEGSRLQCCLCGRWFAALSHHARQAHQLSADAYRARAGLPPGTPLDAPALRAIKRGNVPRPARLVTVDSPLSWDGPVFGELGVFARDGDRAQCHACGGWYKSVGIHAYLAHGLPADAYRAAFGLRAGTGLVGPALRERLRELATPRFRAWQPVHAHYVTDQTTEDHVRLRRERPMALEARKDPANRQKWRQAAAAAKERQQELRADPAYRRQVGERVSAARGGRVAVVCAVCGAPLLVTQSAARSFRHHLCSAACIVAFRERWAEELHRRPRDLHQHTLTCQHCGAVFQGRRGQRYCSYRCKGRAQKAKAHREPTTCPGCGTVFAAAPGQRYCSPGCAARWFAPALAVRISEVGRRRGRPHAEALRALPPTAFDALPELERVVVRRYYGLDGDPPATQREIARACSISNQRVGPVVARASARLLDTNAPAAPHGAVIEPAKAPG